MKWLVFGASGQLGSDLMSVLSLRGHEATGAGKDRVDVTDFAAVKAAIADAKPDVVVNAASFSSMDAAEFAKERAMEVNGAGARVVSEAIGELQTDTYKPRLVQISTHFVFSGTSHSPYRESDKAEPIQVYGRTKLAGENAVRSRLGDSALIVRTGWVYGEVGPSFIRHLLSMEGGTEVITAVKDVTGQPTWSRDAAERIIELVAANAPAGIYHVSNSGQTSWHGFAREILELLGKDPEVVKPIDNHEMKRAAKRPVNNVLAHDGMARLGLPPMRDWQAALTDALPHIVRRH